MSSASTTWVQVVVAGLLLAKWATQSVLEILNRRYVRCHREEVPPPFREVVVPETYRKSVDYTLAKSRFHQVEITWNLLVLATVLISGLLPWFYHWTLSWLGTSAWAQAACLFAAGAGLSLLGLPLDWWFQFRLEDRFGFNTTTQRLWWIDRLKGLCLAGLLGYSLLVLVLQTVRWAGSQWWLWAWALFIGFQLLVALLAPVLILPLFNKFTPLPEGSLKERLLALARKTHFQTKGIQVMDGSKRSRHSNAFFTGFGAFRRIVLFDTLIQQLTEEELESVLAHEVGHYKHRHIPKSLILAAAGSLAAFYLIHWLATQPWFYSAFGFPVGDLAPALLLFMLLSSTMTFWMSPVTNWWSRHNEYEADAYAAEVTSGSSALIRALRKLNEKNLSNLTPHPVYSSVYYSHPTLLERETALAVRSTD